MHCYALCDESNSLAFHKLSQTCGLAKVSKEIWQRSANDQIPAVCSKSTSEECWGLLSEMQRSWLALICCKIHPLLFQLLFSSHETFQSWCFLSLSSFSLSPSFSLSHSKCPPPKTSQCCSPSYVVSILFCFSCILFDLCLEALGSVLFVIWSSPLSCFIFHLQSPVSTVLKHFMYSSYQYTHKGMPWVRWHKTQGQV